MLNLIAGLSICLQGAVALPSARNLPKDRTLLAGSVVGAETLWKHRAKIAQLGIFERERMQALVRYVADQSDGGRRLAERSRDLKRLVEVFDRGWTSAFVFTKFNRRGQDRYEPYSYVVGAASEAKRTRRVDNLIAKLLDSDANKKVSVDRFPIADSPLTATWHSVLESGGGNWRFWQSLMHVTKGRYGSFQLGSLWADDPETKKVELLAPRLTAHAQLLGIGTKRGGDRLGDGLSVGEGAQVLGRFVLRIRDHWQNPEIRPKNARIQREIESSGISQWVGAESCFYLDKEGTPRVRAEIHYDVDDKAPSMFLSFRGNKLGLGDEAEHLPDTTLAALRLGLDGAHTEKWLRHMVGNSIGAPPEIAETIVRVTATLTGLVDANAEKATIKDLDDLTIALLPGAAGSLLPEAVLVVNTPKREGEVKAILDFASSAAGIVDKKIKTLGKGEDAVQYVSLKALSSVFNSGPNAVMSKVAMSALGGGFVSAKRVGDRLLVGFNPRTLRKVVRKARKGETLAKRADFTPRFPKASGRALEAWFDFPELARSLRVVDSTLPLIFMGRASAVRQVAVVAGEPGVEIEEEEEEQPKGAPKQKPRRAKFVMPRSEDFATVLRVESLWAEAAPKKWILNSAGGSMLSPSVWTVFATAIDKWESLSRLARHK